MDKEFIVRLPYDSFTWNRWRAFNLFCGINARVRYDDIKYFKKLLQTYVVGYIESQKTICRPKENHFAVMFLKDNIFSWCHLTEKEFYYVFKRP